MKITKVENSPNFTGFMNNKAVLKGLETISNHSCSFVQGASFVGATMLRPLAISLTPKSVDSENKDYAKANSIASGISKLLIAEAIALPLEFGVNAIEKNPEKFLKKETIQNLKGSAKNLAESKDFKFLAQCIKLGGNILSAIPKSMLTIAMIPFFMDLFLGDKKNDKENCENNSGNKKESELSIKPDLIKDIDPVFSKVQNSISFKGAPINKLSKTIGKVFDINAVQEFGKKHSKNSKNIARDVSNFTDVLLTGAFSFNTLKSKKIDEDRKKPLIYNSVITTGISILGGVGIDYLVQKGSEKFIENFKEANKNSPKLQKYIEGINVLRPTIIFALIYYGIIPFFSTMMADKLDKSGKKLKLNENS